MAAAAPRRHPTLLILDGADAAGAAALVGHLLAAQPAATLLVTRRAPLRLRSEVVLPVAPLETPDESAEGSEADVDAILRCPAVALFVARATAVSPAFAVTQENARAVAALCRRLDGLPLALELAALWVGTLPVETILARLSGGPAKAALDLLSHGYRDLPPDRQSMRAALASAYEALPPDEQTLFRRLAVFDGAFSLGDAEAVWAATTAAEGPAGGRAGALHIVRTLVGQGLLHRTADSHPPRFRMLHVVRAFALERLFAGGEWEKVGRLADARRGVPLLSTPARPLLPAPSPPSSGASGGEVPATASLSPRERVVLRLVARGMSNREIARELNLSERTVAHHLTAIFNKLGVASRTAAAALALRGGLA